MTAARRELHAIARRVQADAEELAIRAEVTRDDETELAAQSAINNWLVLEHAATTGSEETVEIALDLVRGEFPELLSN